MRIFIILVLLVKPYLIFSQDTKILNADSLQTDFTILKTTLIENHPLMFSYITRNQYDSISNNIEIGIKKGITYTEFYCLVNQLLSQIGCGHTYAFPPVIKRKGMGFSNDLPFEILMLNDSLYISKAYKKDYEKYLGKRINSINKTSIKELMSSVNSQISSDGYNRTHKRFRFQNEFGYYINLFLNNPDSLLFEFENERFVIYTPTKYTKTQTPEPISNFYELPGKLNAVVLTLVDFDEGRRVIKRCFKHIAKNNIENLIIDLRNNPGGNGNIGAFLTSYIIDSTTTYYLEKKTTPLKYKEYFHNGQGIFISNQYLMKDSITKSYYYKIYPKKKNNFNGNLYILVNGGTFSTGAYVSSVLKYKTRSTFIGEETGGSEYAIGGGVIGKLQLPYSRVSIKFPLYLWRFNTTNKQNGTGIIPDYEIIYFPNDLKMGNDKEMEKIIELLNKNQP